MMASSNDLVVSVADLAHNMGHTVLHWNCQSLYPKWEEICHIINKGDGELNFFTDSWLDCQTPDAYLHLDGYVTFRMDRDIRSGKKRGGGIIAFVKEKLRIEMVDSHTFCSTEMEILTLKLDLTRTRDIFYLCIYRPPGVMSHLSLVNWRN